MGVTSALGGHEVVFHLAAYANVDEVFQNPVDAMATNLMGTVQVNPMIITEETPLAVGGPCHLYSSAKAAADWMCHDYARLYGLPFTVLRYGIPYGPHMRKELVIRKFLTQAMEGKPLILNGGGLQSRSFIDIDDLAHAHLLALRPEAENQVFNLPGPRNVTIREVAEVVVGLFGGKVELHVAPVRPGD